MNKRMIFIMLTMMLAVACTKKDEASFTNSLTFGTGVNASNFTLTGTSNSFQSGTTIYFRLESESDMAGSTVKISFINNSTGVETFYERPATQDYGHIMISNFNGLNAGTYTATGILVTGNKIVANALITIIPASL
jgi:hypothetical protein